MSQNQGGRKNESARCRRRSKGSVIKKIAENEGYEVLEAEDGYEGWRIFQKEKKNIHIALLDWMMPKIDGYQVCSKLREDVRRWREKLLPSEFIRFKEFLFK